MKKIIFVLVILAVLLFSGCDAMLEVFYPEFADDFSETNNLFAVEYYYSQDDMSNYLFNTSKPLKIELYKHGETPEADEPFDSIEVLGEYSYYYEFFVPAGYYDVWIWQDSDITNNGLDFGDFILEADKIAAPCYEFLDGEESWYYYGSNWSNWE